MRRRFVATRFTRIECAVLLSFVLATGCEAKTWTLGTDTRGAGGEPSEPPLGQRPTYGTATWLEVLTSEGDQDDSSLTEDRLELFFSSKRDGGVGREDVWVSRRSDAQAEWEEPTVVLGASSEERETASAISHDGLVLWFASDREGTEGGLDVWSSRRADRNSGFEVPVHHPELSGPTDDLPRSPTEDGAILPFAIRADDMTYDLALSERRSDGTYGAPVRIDSLNTDASEGDPALARAGLWIVFASDRDDPGGDLDLYFAERRTLADAFGVPEPLAELNTGDDETDPWLSSDGSIVYFTSTRSGQLEIYFAERVD